MRNSFVLVFLLFSILSVAYASPTVINIAVSYNSTSNTITITPDVTNIALPYNSLYYLNFTITGANALTQNMILIAPSLPQVKYSTATKHIAINQSSFWLNQTQPITTTTNTATFSIINYNIVPPPPVIVNLGSYNASWTSPVQISKTSSIYSVTGTINQIPKLNIYKNFTPSWTSKQTYQSTLYGINITINQIPKLNLANTITPSWVANEVVANSTIGLNITILKIPSLNITQIITPSWTQNQILSNSLYGINVIVLKIPPLNINKVITPSWTSQQKITNSTIGLNITVGTIPKLNITQTLLPGQQYKNSTYGLNILASPITANMLTTNDLINYYNSQTANCLSFINFTTANGIKYSICARGAGQNDYSIVDICTGLARYQNISSGLAGCVGTFAQLANSSAVYWHNEYLQTFNQLQNVTRQFEAYKSGAAAGAAYAQGFEYIIATLLILAILYSFYSYKKKEAIRQTIRPPINKV